MNPSELLTTSAPTIHHARTMPRSGVHPLSDEQLAQAALIASRLFAELRRALDAVPQSHRTARGMARFLGLDANATQRILRAIRGNDATSQLLVTLPGSATLARFFKAVARRTRSGYEGESGLAAVKQFDHFIESAAGSHARLASRLRAGGVPGGRAAPDPAGSERSRRRLFLSASEIRGASMELNAGFSIYKPLESDPRRSMEAAYITALMGVEVAPDARPIVYRSAVFTALPVPADYSELTRDFTLATRFRALVPEFSSSPPPRLITRQERSSLLQLVEPPLHRGEGPFDASYGYRASPIPHPLVEEDPQIVVGSQIRIPLKRLMGTTFLHRDLAAICTPTIGAFVWSPEAFARPQSYWYDAFSPEGTLELLGPGLARAATPHWNRSHELVSFMFRRLKWNPDDFVGYRFSVAYPCWGMGYYIMFNFGPETPDRSDAAP